MNFKLFAASCLVAAVLVGSVEIFGYAFPIVVIIVYAMAVWRKKG